MATKQMLTIAARRGAAAQVTKGQRITVINTHGAQVVDTWAFAASDVTEWMSMECSRAWFLKLRASVGDTFFSNQRRPILTLVDVAGLGRRGGGAWLGDGDVERAVNEADRLDLVGSAELAALLDLDQRILHVAEVIVGGGAEEMRLRKVGIQDQRPLARVHDDTPVELELACHRGPRQDQLRHRPRGSSSHGRAPRT